MPIDTRRRMAGWLGVLGLAAACALPAAAGGRKSLGLFPNHPEYEATVVRWIEEAPAPVKDTIRALQKGDPLEKGRAAASIRGETYKAAIPALLGILADQTALEWVYYGAARPPQPTNPGEEAAQALVRIGPPACEFFLVALQDAKCPYRRTAAYILCDYKDPAAVGLLVQALQDKDKKLREAAAFSLGEMKAAEAVEPLIAALGRGGDHGAAAAALGKISDPRAVEPLVAALGNGGGDVRQEAATALGLLRDPRAVDPLIRALTKDGLIPVRERAALALGTIGDARAIEPLIQALKNSKTGQVFRAIASAEDFNAGIRACAAVALKRITGQDWGDDYDHWKTWWAQQQAGRLK